MRPGLVNTPPPTRKGPAILDGAEELNRFITEAVPEAPQQPADPTQLEQPELQGMGRSFESPVETEYDAGRPFEADVQKRRAAQQGIGDQLMNRMIRMVPDVAYDTAAYAGYLGDQENWKLWTSGTIDSVDNAFSASMREAKQAMAEKFPVYTLDPEGSISLHDPGTWINSGADIAESVLSFYALGAGAGSLLAKGAQLGARAGLWAAGRTGIRQAANGLMRQAVMNGAANAANGATSAALGYTAGVAQAVDSYKSVYDSVLKQTGDEQQAKEAAGIAAASIVRWNTAIGMLSNITPLLGVFKPFKNTVQFADELGVGALEAGVAAKRAAEGAAAGRVTATDLLSRLKAIQADPTKAKSVKTLWQRLYNPEGLLFEVGQEALEEGAENINQQYGESLGREKAGMSHGIDFGSEDLWTSVALGAVGGAMGKGMMAGIDTATGREKQETDDFARALNRKIEALEKFQKNQQQIVEQLKAKNPTLTREARRQTFVDSLRHAFDTNTDDLLEATVEDIAKLSPQEAEKLGYDVNENSIDYYKSIAERMRSQIKNARSTYESLSVSPNYQPQDIPELFDMSVRLQSIDDDLATTNKQLQQTKLRGANPGQLDAHHANIALNATQQLVEILNSTELNKQFAKQVEELVPKRQKEFDAALEALPEEDRAGVHDMATAADQELINLEGSRAALETIQGTLQKRLAAWRDPKKREKMQQQRRAESDLLQLVLEARQLADKLIDAPKNGKQVRENRVRHARLQTRMLAVEEALGKEATASLRALLEESITQIYNDELNLKDANRQQVGERMAVYNEQRKKELEEARLRKEAEDAIKAANEEKKKKEEEEKKAKDKRTSRTRNFGPDTSGAVPPPPSSTPPPADDPLPFNVPPPPAETTLPPVDTRVDTSATLFSALNAREQAEAEAKAAAASSLEPPTTPPGLNGPEAEFFEGPAPAFEPPAADPDAAFLEEGVRGEPAPPPPPALPEPDLFSPPADGIDIDAFLQQQEEQMHERALEAERARQEQAELSNGYDSAVAARKAREAAQKTADATVGAITPGGEPAEGEPDPRDAPMETSTAPPPPAPTAPSPTPAGKLAETALGVAPTFENENGGKTIRMVNGAPVERNGGEVNVSAVANPAFAVGSEVEFKLGEWWAGATDAQKAAPVDNIPIYVYWKGAVVGKLIAPEQGTRTKKTPQQNAEIRQLRSEIYQLLSSGKRALGTLHSKRASGDNRINLRQTSNPASPPVMRPAIEVFSVQWENGRLVSTLPQLFIARGVSARQGYEPQSGTYPHLDTQRYEELVERLDEARGTSTDTSLLSATSTYGNDGGIYVGYTLPTGQQAVWKLATRKLSPDLASRVLQMLASGDKNRQLQAQRIVSMLSPEDQAGLAKLDENGRPGVRFLRLHQLKNGEMHLTFDNGQGEVIGFPLEQLDGVLAGESVNVDTYYVKYDDGTRGALRRKPKKTQMSGADITQMLTQLLMTKPIQVDAREVERMRAGTPRAYQSPFGKSYAHYFEYLADPDPFGDGGGAILVTDAWNKDGVNHRDVGLSFGSIRTDTQVLPNATPPAVNPLVPTAEAPGAQKNAAPAEKTPTKRPAPRRGVEGRTASPSPAGTTNNIISLNSASVETAPKQLDPALLQRYPIPDNLVGLDRLLGFLQDRYGIGGPKGFDDLESEYDLLVGKYGDRETLTMLYVQHIGSKLHLPTVDALSRQLGTTYSVYGATVPTRNVKDFIEKNGTLEQRALLETVREVLITNWGSMPSFVFKHIPGGSVIDGKEYFVAGRYVVDEEVVQLNVPQLLRYSPEEATSSLVKTTLHELLHHLTYKEIHRDFGQQVNPFNVELSKLLDIAQAAAKKAGKSYYGLTNVDELVAEAFTNPEFQLFLASIPYKGSAREKTLWDAFIHALGETLRKLGVSVKDTLLEEVLSAVASRDLEMDTAASAYAGEEIVFQQSPKPEQPRRNRSTTAAAGQQLNEQQAVAWLKARGIPVEVHDIARRLGDPMLHGYFQDALVVLNRAGEVGTEFHEAFHYAFHIWSTTRQAKELLLEARQRFNLPATFTDLQVEEHVAEFFRLFMLGEKQLPPPIKQKLGTRLLNFFRDLLAALRISAARRGSIDRLFNQLQTGNIDKTFSRQPPKGVRRNSAKKGYPIEEQMEIRDAIAQFVLGGNPNISEAERFLAARNEFLRRSFVDSTTNTYLSVAQAQLAYEQTKNGTESAPEDAPYDYSDEAGVMLGVYEKWFNEAEPENSRFVNPVEEGWQVLAARTLRTNYRYSMGEDLMEVLEARTADDAKERIYGKAITEQSVRETLNAEVKKYLLQLKDIGADGQPRLTMLGTMRYLPFDDSFPVLLNKLQGITSPRELLSRIQQLQTEVPWAAQIYNALLENNQSSVELLVRFYSTFSNAYKYAHYLDMDSYHERVRNEHGRMVNGAYRQTSRIVDADQVNTGRTLAKVAKSLLYIPQETGGSGLFTMKDEEYVLNTEVYDRLQAAFNRLQTVSLRSTEESSIINEGTLTEVGEQHVRDLLEIMNIFGLSVTLEQLRHYVGEGASVGRLQLKGRGMLRYLLGKPGSELSAPIREVKAGKDPYETSANVMRRLVQVAASFEKSTDVGFLDLENKMFNPIQQATTLDDWFNRIRQEPSQRAMYLDDVFYVPQRSADGKPMLGGEHTSLLTYWLNGDPSFPLDNFEASVTIGTRQVTGAQRTVTPGDEYSTLNSWVYRLSSYLSGGKESARYVLPIFADRGKLMSVTLPRLTKLRGNGASGSHITVLNSYVVQDILRAVRATREFNRGKEDPEYAQRNLIRHYHYQVNKEDPADYSKPGRAMQFTQLQYLEKWEDTAFVLEQLGEETFKALGRPRNAATALRAIALSEHLDDENAFMTSWEEKKELVNRLATYHDTYLAQKQRELQRKLAKLGVHQSEYYESGAFKGIRNHLDLAAQYGELRLGEDSGSQLNEMLEDFVYADMVVRLEMMKHLVGDSAMYRSYTDFSKRFGVLETPGIKSSEARYHPEQAPLYGDVSSFHTAFVNDDFTRGESTELLRELRSLGLSKATLDQYEEAINKTDAMGWTTLEKQRAKMQGLAQWTDEHEKAYQNYLTGDVFGVPRERNGKVTYTYPALPPQKTNTDSLRVVNGRIVRVIVKHSTIPLLREFTRRLPALDSLRRAMEEQTFLDEKGQPQRIDVVNTATTAKAACWGNFTMEMGPDGRITNLDKLTPIQIQTRDERTPQLVPTEQNKQPGIGSQLMKLVTANIPDTATYVLQSGQVLTGAQWKKTYGEVLSTLLQESETELLDDLGFTDALLDPANALSDERAEFLQNLQQRLLAELAKRDTNDNFRKALYLDEFADGFDFRTPISLPPVGERFQATLLTLWKSNVLRQRIHGQSLVQLAELGEGILPQQKETSARYNPSQVVEGDLFTLDGIVVVPTNLGGVHGAGVAQKAKEKGFIRQGEGKFGAAGDGTKAVMLPVKAVWSDKTDMTLLTDSLEKMVRLANLNGHNTYLMPLIGLGHGEGDPELIIPLIKAALARAPNLKLVLPAEGVSLGRAGTVRQDRTREMLPRIKALLKQKSGTRELRFLGKTTRKDKDGKVYEVVGHAECAIPWKLAEKLGIPKDADGEYDLSKVDPKLLTLISYRIPTSDKNSMLHLKIVRVLPPSVKGILVPGFITKQMGSDFDVDKLFTMMPNIESVYYIPGMKDIGERGITETQWIQDAINDRLKELDIDKYISHLQVKKLLASESAIDDLLDEVPDFLADGVQFKDAIRSIRAEFREIIASPGVRKETRLVAYNPDARKNTRFLDGKEQHDWRERLENYYMDLVEAVLSAPQHVDEVAAPIDSPELPDLAKELKQVNARRELREIGITSPDAAMIAQWLEADPNSPMTEPDLEARNRAGAIGIGQWSVASTSSAIRQHLVAPDGRRLELHSTFAVRFDGESLQSLVNTRSADGELITQAMSKHQNAALDNANNPIPGYINDNSFTHPVLNLLRSTVGKPALWFVNQPIILRLTEYMELNQLTPNRLWEAVNAVGSQYSSSFTLAPETTNLQTTQLRKDMLELLPDTISAETETDPFIQRQLQVLRNFYLYHEAGRMLGKVNKTLNPDRVQRMTSLAELRAFEQTMAEVEDTDTTAGRIPRNRAIINTDLIRSTYEPVAAYHRSLERIKQIVGQFFPQSNPGFEKVEDALRQLLNKPSLDASLLNTLYRDAALWQLTQPGSPLEWLFTQEHYTRLMKGPTAVVNRLYRMHQRLPKNLLLRKLSAHPDNVNFRKNPTGMMTLAAPASYEMEKEEQNILIDNFIDLLSSKDDEIRQFGIDLAHYSLLSTGFTGGAGSLAPLVPFEFWTDDTYYPNGNGATFATYWRQAQHQWQDTAFWLPMLPTFIRNNTHIEGLVPQIYSISREDPSGYVAEPRRPFYDRDLRQWTQFLRYVDKESKETMVYRFDREETDEEGNSRGVYKYITPLGIPYRVKVYGERELATALAPTTMTAAATSALLAAPAAAPGVLPVSQEVAARLADGTQTLFSVPLPLTEGEHLLPNGKTVRLTLYKPFPSFAAISKPDVWAKLSAATVDPQTLYLSLTGDLNSPLHVYQVQTAALPVVSAAPAQLAGQMTYAYGTDKRAGVTADTTIEAIRRGERTATTRYEDSSAFAYWQSAKVGDIITWKGTNGEKVKVRVTKPLTKLTTETSPEEWSKKEGWSTGYFEREVRPKLDRAWQMEYEVLENTPELTAASALPVAVVATSGEPVPGVIVQQGALSREEQLEMFEFLRPILEAQGKKTNKGAYAPIMIGLGVRWDYKDNNPGLTPINLGETLAGKNTSYGYFTTAVNGEPLAPVPDRFKQLLTRASGIDVSNYDGAIINLYTGESFIGNHADLEESASAAKYPVVVANIGGEGNVIMGNRGLTIPLQAGATYAFGVGGVNRKIPHSTMVGAVNGFLPKITVGPANRTFPAGSYRISVTLRRVRPLENGMPEAPTLAANAAASTAPVTTPSTGRPTPVLDTVPAYTPGQRTLVYAGIGSRETPPEVQRQMEQAAKNLQALGYTLHSGGAKGADVAFERGAGSQKNIFVGNDAANDAKALAIVNEVHPKPSALVGISATGKPYDMRPTMARNAYQVFGRNLDAPVDFVLAWTPDGAESTAERSITTGGTGQAIDLASRKGIPVINMAKPGWEQRLADTVGRKTPAQPASREVEPLSPTSGGNVSTNSKGLLAALTNPTEIAKQKGNLKQSYPLVYNGKQYADLEAAYKANKINDDAIARASGGIAQENINLMRNLMVLKLRQYPQLVDAILEKGGSAWLKTLSHIINGNRWEGNGLSSPFVSALVDAYGAVVTPGQERTLQVLRSFPALVLNEDQSRYVDASGNQYQRVTSLLEKPDFKDPDGDYAYTSAQGSDAHGLMEAAAKRLPITEAPNPSGLIAEDVRQQIYDHFVAFFAQLRKEGYRIVSEKQVSSAAYGVAGTIDIMAIAPDGSIRILDGKTTTREQFNKWSIHYSGPSKSEAHKRQLSVYDKLLQDVDITVTSREILPILVKRPPHPQSFKPKTQQEMTATGFDAVETAVKHPFDKEFAERVLFQAATQRTLPTAVATLVEGATPEERLMLREDGQLVKDGKVLTDPKQRALALLEAGAASGKIVAVTINDAEFAVVLGYGAPRIISQAAGQEVLMLDSPQRAQVLRETAELLENLPTPAPALLSLLQNLPQNTPRMNTDTGVTPAMLPTVNPELIAGDEDAAPEANRFFKLPDGRTIRFNDQQQEALTRMKQWVREAMSLQGSKQWAFVLQGYAGTGKTTITKALVESIKDDLISVQFVAPTHKAKGVLERASGEEAITLAKLLGLNPAVNLASFDPAKPEFMVQNDGKFGSNTIIVLDEASMVNKALYRLLYEKAQRNNSYLLFMGDPAQLPPVGEELSAVFAPKPEVKHLIELTQVERQKGGNPMLPVLDMVRSDIGSKTDKFLKRSAFNEKGEGIAFIEAPRFRREENSHKRNYGVTNEFYIFANLLKTYFSSPEYAQDSSHSILLTYDNRDVKYYNELIRHYMFPNATAPYVVGDILMGYTGGVLENGATYKVIAVQPDTKKWQKTWQGQKYTFEAPGHNLLLVNTDEDIDLSPAGIEKIHATGDLPLGAFQMFVPLSTPEINERLVRQERFLKSVADRDRTRKKDAYKELYDDFRASFNTSTDVALPNPDSKEITKLPKTFDYGYAVTIHKSQGSTYKNVFWADDSANVFEETYIRGKKWDRLGEYKQRYQYNNDKDKFANDQYRERNSLTYVALSRATTKVFVSTRGVKVEDRLTKEQQTALLNELGTGFNPNAAGC